MPAPGTRLELDPSLSTRAVQSVKIRAIVYVRVSKANEDTFSPEQQQMVAENFAELNGIVIVDVVVDLNQSGRKTNYEKRKIADIIERIAKGEADVVLVWKYSRFGRSAMSNKVYISLLEEKGGRLLSATEIGNEPSASGRFSRDVIMAVDEFYAAQLGEVWKDTFERRRRAGLRHTGRPQFGYARCEFCVRNDHDNGYLQCKHCKGVFVIDPLRGPALKEMYVRLLAGEPMNRLVTEMAKRGIKSTADREMKSSSWFEVMDSGFAAGLLRFRSNPKKSAFKEESWDIWVQGAHDALITMEQWQKYRKLRAARRKTPARSRDPKYEFTGLLRCGGTLTDGSPCRLMLRAQPSAHHGGRWVSYRCPNREVFKICDGRGVSERIADRVVYEWILEQSRDESAAEDAMLATSKLKEARQAFTDLAAQIEKTAAKQEKLTRGWLDGNVKEHAYRNLSEELDEELEGLRARQAMTETTIEAVALGPEDYRPIAENWQHATGPEKNQLLRQVVDHLITINGEPRKPSTCRVVARGEKYDYSFPARGRRAGAPMPQLAKR